MKKVPNGWHGADDEQASQLTEGFQTFFRNQNNELKEAKIC